MHSSVREHVRNSIADFTPECLAEIIRVIFLGSVFVFQMRSSFKGSISAVYRLVAMHVMFGYRAIVDHMHCRVNAHKVNISDQYGIIFLQIDIEIEHSSKPM